MPTLFKLRSVLLALLCCTGCGEDLQTKPPPVDLPWPLVAFPDLPPAAVDVPEARIKLGEVLFFDPILSVDGETACVTCHSEIWGMSDGLPRSVGNGAGIIAGPSRSGPNVLRRNSLALWNLAFREDLFWDGRTKTLEEQATEPLLERVELDRRPEEVIADLADIEEYVNRFAEAFPDDPRVTIGNFELAIAAFERSLLSNRSLYDAYVTGDEGAMSPEMIEGMFRFAEFECNSCHTPPLFESARFENRHVPTIEGLVDDGRAEATEQPTDRGKFRTPTLRNIVFTEPYFHNGSTLRLEEVVAHELSEDHESFTDEDVRLITAFISRALRDLSRNPDRPQTVPSGLPVPLDQTDF